MKDWRCLRYDGLRCFLRHEAGRWGCGVCGRVGFWLKAGLRFHQRFLCRGAPRRDQENAAPDDSCGPCMRPGCPRCVGWALRNSKEVGNGPQ